MTARDPFPVLRTALLALTLVTSCRGGGPSPHPAASVAPSASATAPSVSAGPTARGSASNEAPAPESVAASVARGAELYAHMCAVCHGAHGEGYRADRAPALGHPDFLASVSDEFLDFAIAMGRARTTMSAWRRDQGGPLTAADVRSLIALLRSWEGPPVALDESYVHGDAARGKAIFASTCSACHGPKGSSIHLLNRQWLVHAKPAFMRYAIARGRPTTKMVGYEESLGAEGVEDVMAYLKTLPSWLVPGEIAGTTKPPPIPLGPVPLHPHGPAPKGFHPYPEPTLTKVVWAEFHRGARMGFLDARAPSDYLMSHIEGAVSVPFYDPSSYLDALPKSEWLVCYCGCPQAESGALARQLLEAGFAKVTVLEDGFGAWTAANHPVHTGRLP